MPKFGSASRTQLATCHPKLQEVMNEAIKFIDFTVLEGFRGKEAQNAAYAAGNSQKKWPNGNHNRNPSTACDVTPFPADWSDKAVAHERFVYLAGYIMATAERMGIPLRWGGDWNMNDDTRDENFRDYGHFELVGV